MYNGTIMSSMYIRVNCNLELSYIIMLKGVLTLWSVASVTYKAKMAVYSYSPFMKCG